MGNELEKIVPFKLMAEAGLGKIKEVMAELVKDATRNLTEARSLVVVDDEGCKKAKQDFDMLRTKSRDIEDARKLVVTPLNDIVKAVNSACKEPMEIYDSAKSITEKKAVAYELDKERKRQDEERRLRIEAERKEREAREEKERQEREWRAKEEAKRREAEEAERKAKEAKNEEERARLQAEADKRWREADKAAEKASERAVEASNVFVPAPVVEKVKVKQEGTKDVTRWRINVVDAKKVPFEIEFNGEIVRLWVLDEAAIQKIASAHKGPSMIPGVEFYSEKKLS